MIKNPFTAKAPEGRETRQSVITKRADSKLNYVVDLYRYSLGKQLSHSESQFLDKRIYLKDMRVLEDMRLYYRVENRFFAISYDLCYEVFSKKVTLQPDDDSLFSIKFGGGLRVKNARFTAAHELGDVGRAILYRLNDPLIIDRILSCSITDAEIRYDIDSSRWRIFLRSLIGSVTWNLIPPITQLIKPKEDECLRTVELLELMTASVM